MLDRLLGLETEYAIRFRSAEGSPRPGNRILYSALAGAIADLVQTQPGERRGSEDERFFTEGGASICYEHYPDAPDGGLIEAGTPECRGPTQLLRHQKAIDALLCHALPAATKRLAAQGYEGEFGLLKNCRDAEGHIYGAQENYEAEVGRGLSLLLYRVILALVAPFIVLHAVVVWLLIAALLLTALTTVLVLLFAALLIPPWRRSALFERLMRPGDPTVERVLVRVAMPMERATGFSMGALGGVALRLAFRPQRRAMLAFLVARPILSGAGTVDAEGRFGLSEKGPAIRRVIRSTTSSENRPIFDTGNLMKDLFSPAVFRVRPLLQLFRGRQRMQLGLSDSNMAQAAELLKVGTTALVLEMAEAGALADAPQLRDPVAALHAIVADPTLKARVEVVGGPPMTALELQREYLRRARAFVRSSPSPSMEAHQIVTLWDQALSDLEADPGRLVGTLDWVSKRYLIEACAADERSAVQKKIDLAYHELGTGYFARMEQAGLARRFITDAEALEACTSPPASTPARLRGELIRSLGTTGLPIRVSWDSVRIGGRLRGKVIHLRDYRRPE